MISKEVSRAALLATAFASFGLAVSAHAGVISMSVDTSDPFGAESSFIAGAVAFTTEDFEDIAVGKKDTSVSALATDVGGFQATGLAGKTSGQCQNVGDGACDDLAVLDHATSPFSGRYDTSDGDGDDAGRGRWLDSNDVSEISWVIDDSNAPGANALGLFVMDVADVGATMTINLVDGTSWSEQIAFFVSESNGKLAYVSAVADMAITSATVRFANIAGNIRGDGFGIDNVTLARTTSVPEPGSLLLLGGGLLGMLVARRRRTQPAG